MSILDLELYANVEKSKAKFDDVRIKPETVVLNKNKFTLCGLKIETEDLPEDIDFIIKPNKFYWEEMSDRERVLRYLQEEP